MGAIAEVRLQTTGMHCRSCSMLVDITLGDLDGVEAVTTDHVTGSTHVRFDPDRMDVERMIAEIRAVGYDAEVQG